MKNHFCMFPRWRCCLRFLPQALRSRPDRQQNPNRIPRSRPHLTVLALTRRQPCGFKVTNSEHIQIQDPYSL